MTGLLRALGAGVLLLALAACTQPDDDPEPIMPSESTSPTSPVSSPTPEPESAEEFVRRWVSLNREMLRTGDKSAFLAVSLRCSPCQGIADRVSEIYEAGGYVRTRGWTVLRIQRVTRQPASAQLTVLIRSAPTQYRESSSGEIKALPGGRLIELFELTMKHGEWRMVNFSEVEQ